MQNRYPGRRKRIKQNGNRTSGTRKHWAGLKGRDSQQHINRNSRLYIFLCKSGTNGGKKRIEYNRNRTSGTGKHCTSLKGTENHFSTTDEQELQIWDILMQIWYPGKPLLHKTSLGINHRKNTKENHFSINIDRN